MTTAPLPAPSTAVEQTYLIRHVIIEASGCPFAVLDSPARMLALLEAAARIIRTEVMQASAHHFTPHGVTAMLIVGASHLSVHTWPEYAFATLDLVICTEDFSMDAVLAECKRLLEADSVSVLEFRRGLVRVP